MAGLDLRVHGCRATEDRMTRSRPPSSPSRPGFGPKTNGPADIVLIDAREPDLEQRISQNMFRGVAFAISYEHVPVDIRDRLQDEHVSLMKAIQSLARERHRSTLQ
jgi:hypothetical protein